MVLIIPGAPPRPGLSAKKVPIKGPKGQYDKVEMQDLEFY
jgi:hypothetical protein